MALTPSSPSDRPKPQNRAEKRRLRRGILFGDSHVVALQQAVMDRQREGADCRVELYRLLKMKNGKAIGDTSFEQFMRTAASLAPDDLAISVMGGNQYAVVSTIQHPRPFEFLTPGERENLPDGVEGVPYNAVYDYFSNAIREGVGQSLIALRKVTSAHVIHLLAPPPKCDNAFLLRHHDSTFASAGIASLGVSRPSLRLKFWNLQNRVLRELAEEIGIGIIEPPQEACDEHGFLVRECYGNDATHANAHYGELVLRQLEWRFFDSQADEE